MLRACNSNLGGRGGGGRMGQDPERRARHQRDKAVFHALLDHHEAIRRHVEELPDGIRAVTESDDPQVAAMIRDHAHEMHRRMQEGFGLRFWDAAFAEIFAQKDKVVMSVRDTERGVVIEEISTDPNVALLIKAHGAVVSGFVHEGRRAASQESPLPDAYQRVL